MISLVRQMLGMTDNIINSDQIIYVVTLPRVRTDADNTLAKVYNATPITEWNGTLPCIRAYVTQSGTYYNVTIARHNDKIITQVNRVMETRETKL